MDYVKKTARISKGFDSTEKEFYSNCFTETNAPREITLIPVTSKSYKFLAKQKISRNVFKFDFHTESVRVIKSIRELEARKLMTRVKKYLSLESMRTNSKSKKRSLIVLIPQRKSKSSSSKQKS